MTTQTTLRAQRRRTNYATTKDTIPFKEFSIVGWAGENSWITSLFKNSLLLYETKKQAVMAGHKNPASVKITVKKIKLNRGERI